MATHSFVPSTSPGKSSKELLGDLYDAIKADFHHSISSSLKAAFSPVHEGLDRIEANCDEIKGQLDEIKDRLDEMEGHMDARFDRLDASLSRIVDQMETSSKKLDLVVQKRNLT